jgi:hypothetical protein
MLHNGSAIHNEFWYLLVCTSRTKQQELQVLATSSVASKYMFMSFVQKAQK